MPAESSIYTLCGAYTLLLGAQQTLSLWEMNIKSNSHMQWIGRHCHKTQSILLLRKQQ